MTSNPPRLPLHVLILAGTLIGTPWATGGRSPGGQAAVVLLVVTAAAAHLLTARARLSVAPLPFLLPAGILAAVSAVQTMHPDRTLQLLPLHAAYLLAAVITWQAAEGAPGDEDVLRTAIAVSGILVGIVGMVSMWRGGEGGMYAAAMIGPFGYPNAMGGFLLLAGGAALAGIARGTLLARGLAALGCLTAAAGLHLTGSRGAALSAMLGLLVWACLQREMWRGRRRALALVGLAGFLLWAVPNAGRLADLGTVWGWSGARPADTSVLWRMSMLRSTWAMIRDHPWAGVGPGAFPVALAHYQRIPYVSGENPHNLFLEVAAEYGLPAAALLICAVAALFARLVPTLRRLPLRSPGRARAAVLAATLAAWLTHAAIDMDANYPAIALTAAVLAGLVARSLPMPHRSTHGRWRLSRAVPVLVLAALGTVALTRYAATSLITLGRIELEGGDAKVALRTFSRAAGLNPFSTAARQGLAWARRRAGDPSGALDAAERAVRIAPSDPNAHALVGELALADRRWELAEAGWRRAVERAPAAHLRYHAGLLEANAAASPPGEGLQAYERALTLFTPERVLHAEARCLAPGDRYLLARMSRLAADLYGRIGEGRRQEEALKRAARLAAPDFRGICARDGPPGRSSPEAAVSSFWDAWTAGGGSLAQTFLIPDLRPGHARPPAEPGPRNGWRRARLGWVAAFRGDEHRALLVYELEVAGEAGLEGRCARTAARWTRDGWLVENWPAVDRKPCGQ